MIYQLEVISAGKVVEKYLSDGKIILFSASAPNDIADYCVLHHASSLLQPLSVGQIIEINDINYPITAVGDVASENLKNLGHITLSFDGKEEADLAGTVHLAGTTPEILSPGEK
ncbi:MAG: PTS system glucitol/sorbitol-specific EIIA component [Candidatus Erwinia impunctatus]|nr:PTS system glucitol/sorbitol-specific EIIA component [Culicoides impunctatus]